MYNPTPKQQNKYKAPTKSKIKMFPRNGILKTTMHKKILNIKDVIPKIKYGIYLDKTKANFVICKENNPSIVPLSHSLDITRAVKSIPIIFIVIAKEPGSIK